jgi:hypothetical protein
VISSKDALIPVEWGQREPYWNNVKHKSFILCKEKNVARTGCVATAAAQMMAYWNYPENINGVNFDWNGLTRKTYVSATNSADAELRKQVAHLMERIGSNTNMGYGCTSSGTDTYKARDYMRRLGYQGGAESKYNFNAVVGSLDKGRPVLARGDRTFKYIKIFGKKIGYTTNGHAWVIDGYVKKRRFMEQKIIIKNKKTGQIVKSEITSYWEYNSFIHNNWGWDGSHNGWFTEGCFDSNNGNVPNPLKMIGEGNDFDAGESGNYRYNNKIYHNLVPAGR